MSSRRHDIVSQDTMDELARKHVGFEVQIEDVMDERQKSNRAARRRLPSRTFVPCFNCIAFRLQP